VHHHPRFCLGKTDVHQASRFCATANTTLTTSVLATTPPLQPLPSQPPHSQCNHPSLSLRGSSWRRRRAYETRQPLPNMLNYCGVGCGGGHGVNRPWETQTSPWSTVAPKLWHAGAGGFGGASGGGSCVPDGPFTSPGFVTTPTNGNSCKCSLHVHATLPAAFDFPPSSDFSTDFSLSVALEDSQSYFGTGC
jgi:hypothetical protein